MATVDYFLIIDGIKGETSDEAMKKKDALDVLSWSWGESNAATAGEGGGLGAGKVQIQDLHFTTKLSKASPVLMLTCATGKHIPKAELVARKAGGTQEQYYKITLTDVMVSSYQVGGSAGDVIPTDQVSLAFNKFQIEYKIQSEKGAVAAPSTAGWDRSANKIA
jgi:type VI secretion system secreted protein Hcp